MAKTKTYDVTSPLQHDGKDYAPGSTIELEVESDTVQLLKRLSVIADKSARKAAGDAEAKSADTKADATKTGDDDKGGPAPLI